MPDEVDAPFAHDVYAVLEGREDWWLATLRTKRMAEDYVDLVRDALLVRFPTIELVVRPL